MKVARFLVMSIAFLLSFSVVVNGAEKTVATYSPNTSIILISKDGKAVLHHYPRGFNNDGTIKGTTYTLKDNVRQVAMTWSGVIDLDSKAYFFVTNNNELWGIGQNRYGELGDDTGITKPVTEGKPAKIMDNVLQVYTCPLNNTVFAVKTDKSLWVWGSNASKYVGGKNDNLFKPVKCADGVEELYLNWLNENKESIPVVRKTDGKLYYGNKFDKATGNVLRSNNGKYVGVVIDKKLYPLFASKYLTTQIDELGGVDNLKMIRSIGDNYYAVDIAGRLWGWGKNEGYLGDGTKVPREQPVLLYLNTEAIFGNGLIKSYDGYCAWVSNKKDYKVEHIGKTEYSDLREVLDESYIIGEKQIYTTSDFSTLTYFNGLYTYDLIPKDVGWISSKNAENKGKASGVSILYKPATKEYAPSDSDLILAFRILSFRAARKYSNFEIDFVEGGGLRIDIPNVLNIETAVKEIGQTAQVKFVDEKGNVILTGKDIKNVFRQKQEGSEYYSVLIELSGDGKKLFEQATAKNIGKKIAVKIDDIVIANPTIGGKITDGRISISGAFTAEYATTLTTLIVDGSLPFSLNVVEVIQNK